MSASALCRLRQHCGFKSQSPSEAIEIARKIDASERTNPVDREVVAKAMGYTGLTGRSAKVLSDLLQYGLLEKAGKNEVRVSRRAIEVIHPKSEKSALQAIADSAFEPELFQIVREKFPSGTPSEGALRSFLIRENFTDAALPSAMRAYLQTAEFVLQRVGSESNSITAAPLRESAPDQSFMEPDRMRDSRVADAQNAVPPGNPHGSDDDVPFKISFERGLGIKISGVIATQEDAEDAIWFIQALQSELPMERNDQPTTPESQH